MPESYFPMKRKNKDDDDRIDFGYAQIGAVNLHYATAGAGEKLAVPRIGFSKKPPKS